MLSAIGITRVSNWAYVTTMAVALTAAFALLGAYLYHFAARHLYSIASIGLMSTVALATLLVAVVIGAQYPQFVPVPAAALILSIFYRQRLSLLLTGLLIVFLFSDQLVDFAHVLALATASIVAVGTNVRQRKDLMIRGFMIGFMQVVGFVFGFLSLLALAIDTGIAGSIWWQMALNYLGGLTSCIVAIGSLPFLESLFAMVTPLRLAELADSSQPLLRKLEEEAPGTYQHSLAVANLAEAAARAIGADVNLTRAGSLYHDIGKTVRPRFFIENQLGDTNPHDTMSPEESRDRVLAHVTDGLELAAQYRLPRAVADFIPQHQGTSLMAYFYHKACVRDGQERVDPLFYRYPGPRPQSKEAAIVMLADVSEAVTHSLKNPTEEEVAGVIDKVARARWDDGQFEESSLTCENLEVIKNAFVRVWRTLHHERLRYPSTTTGKMPVPPEL